MRKTAFLTLAMIGLVSINSCKNDSEDNPVPAKDVSAEKRDVGTYEIVSLVAREDLANKYTGTFGSASIELLKTSDTTLTFYVPDIPEGEAVLKFDLASIKFNVQKTAAVNANEVISDLIDNFHAQVGFLNPSTPEEVLEVNGINEYKEEVIALFNSLSEDEKRQTVLFYEANKEVFKAFANTTFTNFDAPTNMRLQSECPRTDFKTFYGCTAENLGDAAIGLKNSSKEFLKMLALAGVSAYLAPASFGLSAFGTTLALGTAGYLLITEVKPAALHFKRSLFPFLEANWIFSKALFQATTEVFQDQISTSLNLAPKFRSLTSSDAAVNPGSSYLINAMSSLSVYWNKLTSVFGVFPAYKNTEEATILMTEDIVVSSISNANVEYLGNTGQSVKFRSRSGNEENFNYRIRVSKQGFIEEKTLNAKVLASDPCNEETTAPVITNMTLECDASNQLSILISFIANGPGAIIGSDFGACDPEDMCYPTRLYFLSPGSSSFDIAANGYSATLKSGNPNAGVIQMRLSSLSGCMNGKTAAETLET